MCYRFKAAQTVFASLISIAVFSPVATAESELDLSSLKFGDPGAIRSGVFNRPGPPRS